MRHKNKELTIKKLSGGFSKLTRKERHQRLLEMGVLTADDIEMLNEGKGLTPDLAERLVENVIGCFQIPLGVAVNFNIDQQDYVIPMATEETSIIAAASKTAKWIREHGEITTKTHGKLVIGQIQLPSIRDFEQVKEKIEVHKHTLINMANQNVAQGLVTRGGGVKDIVVRHVARTDGGNMAVIHVMLDACDAMGANITNQVCEYLKNPIESITSELVGMCILSNLTDSKLTQAKVVIRNIDPAVGAAITEASLFAEHDPYRAATNNKGVLNGIDAVLIATGNDYRAVEAGIHAFAAHTGRYCSVTRWRMEGADLIGLLEAPIVVGVVGGVTKLHPVAKLCLKMLNVSSADQLSRIVAAVGLVQNLGAIRALVTDGIVKGHMRLHTTNLALAAGATEDELPLMKQELAEYLTTRKYISQNDATELLKKIRNK